MRKLLVVLVAVCTLGLSAVAARADGVTVTPVASGLDSPRGLAFLPNGTLVVAEAGHGGDVVIPNGPSLGSDAVPTCVARAGGHLVVADLAGRIWKVTGSNAALISGPTGDSYTGGNHFTGCVGDGDGNVYVVSMFNGLFPAPNVAQTGSVVKVTSSGDVSTVAGGLVFPNGITAGPDGALYVSVGSISNNGGIVRITL